MVVLASVVRGGTHKSCSAAADTDDGVSGSGHRNSVIAPRGADDSSEDARLPYPLPALPSPLTTVKDEGHHTDSKLHECFAERIIRNTETAENGLGGRQSSPGEGSISTTTHMALSPSVVRVRPRANTTSDVPFIHVHGKDGSITPCPARAKSTTSAAASPNSMYDCSGTPLPRFSPTHMPNSFRDHMSSPPLRAFSTAYVHTGAFSAEAGQRLGSMGSLIISAASNSRRPEPLSEEALCDAQQLSAFSGLVPASGSRSRNHIASRGEVSLPPHTPLAASAPQDAEPPSIPENGTSPMLSGVHSCRLSSEPALGPDVVTFTAADGVATPISNAVSAKQHPTPTASALLHVSEQEPQPADSAPPLHDWASSVRNTSTSVARSPCCREESGPTSPVRKVSLLAVTPLLASTAIAITSAQPPRSLGTLLHSNSPSAPSSPLPAAPSPSLSAPTLAFASPTHLQRPRMPPPSLPTPPQQHPEQQQMTSPTRMTLLVHGSEQGEACADHGEGLLSLHGNRHTPLGGLEKGSPGEAGTLYGSSLGGCGGSTGDPTPFSSPEAAGLTAGPNSSIFQSSARPQSKPQQLEASSLGASPLSTQPIARPLASRPRILSTGAVAHSTSPLSLLAPPSATPANVFNGGEHNHSRNVASGGGTAAGGAGGFRSPLMFRSPFASVLAPQAHHHQPHHSHHSATASPHPCLFPRHASVQPPTTPLQLPIQPSPAVQHGPSPSPGLPQQPRQQRPPEPSPPQTLMLSIASSSSLYSGSSPPPLVLSDPALGSGPLPASSLTPTQGCGAPLATALSPTSAHHLAGEPQAAVRRTSRVDSPLVLPLSATMSCLASPSFVSAPWSGTSSPGGAGPARGSSLAPFPGTPGLPSTSSWPTPSEAISNSESLPMAAATMVHEEADVEGTLKVNESCAVGTKGRRMIYGAEGSDAIASHDSSPPLDQQQQQQQPHSHHCVHSVHHSSARGVAAQPAVCAKAWRVLEVSAGNSADGDADVCSEDEQQRLSIAPPADSATVQQPYKDEAPCGVMEVPKSPGMCREGDDSEMNAPRGVQKEADIGNDKGGNLEGEVAASEDVREAPFLMGRCSGSRSSISVHDATSSAASAPPALQPRAMSLHSRSSGSAYVPEHVTEASEEALAVERGFSASSIFMPILPRTAGRAASSRATAALKTAHKRHLWVSAFASLSHGKSGVAPGSGWARGSGAAARLTEHLSASSPPFPSTMSPNHRMTFGTAGSSRSNSSCLGSRCRGSPQQNRARSGRTSSVTIIGVAEDEPVPMLAPGVTSPRPDFTAAGALPREASVSTRSASAQAAPMFPVGVSPLTELPLSPPSCGAGSSAPYRWSPSCNGDMLTPDMAAAAAAAVQRLHRQRPNTIPPLSILPASSPKASAATQSLEGNAEAEHNASALTEVTHQQQQRESDDMKAFVAAASEAVAPPSVSATENDELLDPLLQGRKKGCNRPLHRTPSSVARAVAMALRRPSLSEGFTGGGVPLHNALSHIPNLLMRTTYTPQPTGADPTTAANPGESRAKPRQYVHEDESTKAEAAAVPHLHTSVVSAEDSVDDGAAVHGMFEVLRQSQDEQEQLPPSEQQQAQLGGCFRHPSSSPNLGTIPSSASPAVLAAPQPPSETKTALSVTTSASRRRHRCTGTSPRPNP
ncbi:hypothetical protein LtaPh_0303400 [Leishmania tarentolae]|uniref:Uncharacterized protein n=1 Tax=Leishmania tarentolae TaxID=5689 RepID=A0A640KDF1_LEITA|nr:hypothetical protein LtaPh_0303400 [Leishmania tarentolae]